MGFKLFKSTEDKMKDALFRLSGLVGKDIRKVLESDVPFYMGNYYPVKMYERPLNELIFLKGRLRALGVGLAFCEEAGYFFADTAQVSRFKSSLQKDIDQYGEESRSTMITLLRHFWDNKIPIANVRVFMEGFEIETFVDGEKVKKELLRKPF